MTARDVLGGLHRAHVAKFDELCTLYASHLGYSSNPTELSDEQWEQIAEEVEELTENWDEAPCFDDWDLKPKTEMQRLLAEHHEIGESILDQQDKICRRRRPHRHRH
jgi:hypothetical protein